MAVRALVLRGIRWRPVASAFTFVTAALACAAAVVAPLFLQAAGDSVVRSAATAAPQERIGASVTGPSGTTTRAAVERAERLLVRAGGAHRWYGTPITTVDTGFSLAAAGDRYGGDLLARTGVCGRLRMLSGACDLGPGRVVMSRRAAAAVRAHVGSRLDLVVHGRATPYPVTVAGVYALPDVRAPFWWGQGQDWFRFGTRNEQGGLGTDPLFASATTAGSLPPQALTAVTGQVPLLRDRVGLADRAGVERDLRAVATRVGAAGEVQVSSGLARTLAGTDPVRRAMFTIVVIAAVQLTLLALWILTGLIVRSGESRQDEIRLSRLRGFGRRSVVWVTAAEPGLLCLAAVPVGALLAWLVVVVGGAPLYAPHTTVRPGPAVLVAAALAFGGLLAALAVATVRLLRASAVAPAERRPRWTRGTWQSGGGLVADGLLLVLAAAAFVELASTGAVSGGRTDPLASAAPGLVALAAAVLAVQVVLLAGRVVVRSTRNSRRVGGFLAVREVVRRPVLLRQARVLVVAVCLACFAGSAWAVADGNRSSEGRFTVGADRVVTVSPDAGVDPVAVVRRLDPAGRYAMAASVIDTSSSTLLAVDASRFGAVADWPDGLSGSSAAAVSRALAPRTARPVELRGDRFAVDATAGGGADRALSAVRLQAFLFDETVRTETRIDLGALRRGPARYTARVAAACAGGCRLTGLALAPTSPRAVRRLARGIDLGVRGFAVRDGASWRAAPADLRPSAWRSFVRGAVPGAPPGTARGTVNLHVDGGVLRRYAAGLASGLVPMAGPADRPQALPAVVTDEVTSANLSAAPTDPVPVIGPDGSTLGLRRVGAVPALPRVGTNAVLVDRTLLDRAQSGPPLVGVENQVWLNDRAPPGTIRRLAAAGLRPVPAEPGSAAAVTAGLRRGGIALADDFLLVATAAALVLAAAGTLAVLTGAARVRSAELTALLVAGVPRRALVRSQAAEAVVLAVVSLAGTLAGLVAALVTLPSLPVFARTPLVPPRLVPPALPFVALSAAVVVAVLAASAVAAGLVFRRVRPSLLGRDS